MQLELLFGFLSQSGPPRFCLCSQPYILLCGLRLLQFILHTCESMYINRRHHAPHAVDFSAHTLPFLIIINISKALTSPHTIEPTTQHEVFCRDDSTANTGPEFYQSQNVLHGVTTSDQLPSIEYDEHVRNGPISFVDAFNLNLFAGYSSPTESHLALSRRPVEPISILDQLILEEVVAPTSFHLPILSATDRLPDATVPGFLPRQAAQNTAFQVHDSKVTDPICHTIMNTSTLPFLLPASNMDTSPGSSTLNAMPLDAKNFRVEPFPVPTSFGSGPICRQNR